MARGISLFAGLLLTFLFFGATAATIQSTTTGGNWNLTTSWVGGNVPAFSDDVFIVSGATINLTSNQSCVNLRAEGTFNNTGGTTLTLTVSGNLTLAGTGQITGNSASRSINVAGNLISEFGADGIISGINMTISGATTLQGRVLFNSATGTKTFIGNVNIADGGTIDFNSTATLILTAGLEMNGTSAIGTNSNNTGVMVGVNSFIVNAGATATIGRITLAIVGLSQFNGATIFSSNTGSKSFVGGGVINTNGSIDFTAAVTVSFNNSLTMNGSCSIGSGSTAPGVINSTSTLLISGGAVATIGQTSITIGSTTDIQGTLILNNINGTKTLTGNVNVGAAGAINFSVAETLDMSNNLTTQPGAILGNSGTSGTINVVGNFTPATGGSSFLRGLTLFSVQGDFIVSNTAIVDAGTGVTSISVSGNWNVTSTQPNPFVEGISTVTFKGTALQNIITTETAGETFYNLFFNNTSGLSTGISTAVNINARSLSVTNGNADMAGRDLTITGNASASTDIYASGSVFSSQPGLDFLITDPSKTKSVQFNGTTIGASSNSPTINVTANSIEFNGSDFFNSGTASFTKMQTTDDNCDGGTIFNGAVSLTTASGGGRWVMGNTNPDIFMSTATLTHNGSNQWIIGHGSTGNEFRGATTLNNTLGGFAFGRKNGNGTLRSILFANSVAISQSGTGNFIFADSDAGHVTSVTFQGDITISSPSVSTGDIAFGDVDYGSVTLAPTARFNVLPGTVQGGTTITLRRIVQNGTSLTQTLSISGAGTLDVGVTVADGCTFNAPVNFTSTTIQLRYNNFSGSTNSFTQTGAGGISTNNGGNTFSGLSTFTNQGSKVWRMGSVAADDFNADVRFVRASTAVFDPTYTLNSTFAGNISTVGSTTAVTFGTNGGRVVVDGGGTKSLNADAGFAPTFNKLTLNGGSLTLNTPASIASDLNFTSGVINTTATNLLTLIAGSGVSGTPSNTSHVDGPVKKIGNTAFTFPTGDGGIYRAIGISGPTTLTYFFTAEFFHTPHPFTDVVASPLITVTRCEYWNLVQSSPGSGVSVTLNWNTPDCTPSPYINNPSGLAVARWAGSQWTNEGNNNATTGDATTGSVTSLTTVSSFGSFALGSTTLNNPLPIELISFSAEADEDFVDLLWSTISEHNNDHFTLERSEDGLKFEFLVDLPGAENGQSKKQLDYNYRDAEPLERVSYYRLKQTDFDDRTSVFKVLKIDRGQIEKLKVYPNPSSANNLIKTNVVSVFLVFDAIGKLQLKTEKTNQIDFTGFASGIYLIRSETGLFTKLVIE